MSRKNFISLGLTSVAIQNMLMDGSSLPEIAKKFDVDYLSLIQFFEVTKKDYKYLDFDQKEITEKQEAVNAASFVFDGVYTLETLNNNEVEAYIQYEKKHKFYYEF